MMNINVQLSFKKVAVGRRTGAHLVVSLEAPPPRDSGEEGPHLPHAWDIEVRVRAADGASVRSGPAGLPVESERNVTIVRPTWLMHGEVRHLVFDVELPPDHPRGWGEPFLVDVDYCIPRDDGTGLADGFFDSVATEWVPPEQADREPDPAVMSLVTSGGCVCQVDPPPGN